MAKEIKMTTKLSINLLKHLPIIFLLFSLISCTNNDSKKSSTETEKIKEEKVEPKQQLSVNDSTNIKKEKVYSIEIKSLEDFQDSHFFEKYNCSKSASWLLNNGLTNYSYDTNLRPTVSIDFGVLNNEFKEFGLVFYSRNKLTKNDYTFLNDLLTEFNLDSRKEKVYNFIKKNVETSFTQINKSKSMSVSNLKFRAGKVIQQTITIERK